MTVMKLPPILARKDFDSDKEYGLYQSAEAGEWVSSGDIEDYRDRWKEAAKSTIHDRHRVAFSHSDVVSEDCALAECMADSDGNEVLSLGQARKYYATLEKAK